MAPGDPPASPSPAPASPARAPRRAPRRQLRRILFGVALVVALLLGALALLTNSPLTKALVLPRLEAALGVAASARRAHVNADGTLVIDQVTLHIPGVAGPAADFLSIRRLEVDMDWPAGAIRAARIIEPSLLLSQSLDDDSLNIAALRLPSASGGGAGGGPIPSISIARASLTIGEHRRDTFTPLRSIRVDGKLVPDPDAAGAYRFDLRQTFTDARRPGFLISGRLEQGGLSLVVENFSLDAWRADAAPSPVRPLVQQIDVRGSVPRATFGWSPAEGVRAGMELADVSLNLPIEPQNWDPIAPGVMGPPAPYMRMHSVSGRIEFAADRVTASLDGRLEDLPYHVDLRYNGIEIDSPFEADFRSNDFRLESSPRLWPIAPAEARAWLNKFSRPSATISTRMRIWRDPSPPGAPDPAPIRAAGTMKIRDGSAAYQFFPYRFENLAGTVEFTDSSIVITELAGHAPSGATIRATARIEPLDESAGFDIAVSARDAPIDATMEAAFPPSRGSLIATLFNRPQYERLIADGLIRSPAIAAAERAELDRLVSAPNADPARLATLRARAAIPVFDLGGPADIDLLVKSNVGKNEPVITTLDVRLPDAGLVPEKFPIPVRATGLVARINNGPGTLTSGRFQGIAGGDASVRAAFNIPFTSDGPQEMNPEIDIALRDMPLDEFVIRALPGSGDAGNSVRRILRDLRASGAADGHIRIASRTAPDDLGFDARLTFDNVAAAPEGAVALANVQGTLTASENAVSLRLHADASASGAPACGRVALSLDAQLPADAGPSFHADIAAPDLDLAAPWHDLLRIFSPAAADRIARLAEKHRPSGLADTAIAVRSANDTPTSALVTLQRGRNLAATILGQQIVLPSTHGSARISAGNGPTSIALHDLRGDVSFAGEPAGSLHASGVLPLAPPAPSDPPGPAFTDLRPPLLLSLEHARFESALCRALAAEAGLADSFDSLMPRGTFTGGASIISRTDGPGVESAWIEPASLALTINNATIDARFDAGRIELAGDSGLARGVHASAPDNQWSLRADASWSKLAGGDQSIRAALSLQSTGLPDSLLAALPNDTRAALEPYALRIAGPLNAQDVSLSILRSDDPSRRRLEAEGRLTFERLAADLGVSIADATGAVEGRVEHSAHGLRTRLDLAADSLRADNVRATGLVGIVRSTDDGTTTASASATVHGGRAAIDATLLPPAPAGRAFDATLRAAGIRLKPLLDDLRPDAASIASPASPDPSRGLLDAECSLRGILGRPDSRSGRGSIQVAEGRVVNFPSLVRLIEVSNWQLPTNAPLDFARATFWIDGPRLWFDAINLLSQRVQITGIGALSLPDRRLDLLFTTRPAYGLPVLTAFYSALRDEIMTSRVTGTLANPEFGLVQWSAARRMLGGALGQTPTDRLRHESEFRLRPEPVVLRPRDDRLPAREPPSP